MTWSFFSPLFAEGSLLCETHKRERKFYVERLRLVQFREARRCAAVRGAHCGVMANRNFLTRHRPIKRESEEMQTQATNVTLSQKLQHVKSYLSPAELQTPYTPFLLGQQ